MTNYKKIFYTLSGSIFFIFSSLASTSYSHNVCYTMNVYAEYTDTHSENLAPVIEINIRENILRLNLLFFLQSYDNPTVNLQVEGVSASREFQIEPDPLTLDIEIEHPSDTISQVVREAVRDGYEGLREYLRESGLGQPLASPISIVRNDRIKVPLGLSDYVQIGDVFYIYHRRDYNICSDTWRSESYLTTGTVIEINQNNSILEMGIIQSEDRGVQIGDVVVMSPEINYESRIQGNNNPKKDVLRLGFIPDVFLLFNDNDGKPVRRHITPLIRNHLIREARDFGFRVI